MKIHFVLSLLPIVIASIKSEEDAGLPAQPRLLQAQPEPVDLGLIYDYFTNDATSSRFMTSILFQALFNLIGYGVTTFLWTTFRGANLPAPTTSVDPVTAITDNIFSDQSAATIVTLAAGYAAASSIVVVGLSQLGNPSTLNTGRQSSSALNEHWETAALERTGGISDIVSAIDGVFTVSGALNFVILQLVLNSSFLLFWNVMNLLPDRNPTQTGRSKSAKAVEEVNSFNYNQQDYAIYTGDYGLSRNIAY